MKRPVAQSDSRRRPLRIALSSDIHVDNSRANREAVGALVRRLGEIEPDVFVLAGDVALSPSRVEWALGELGEAPGRKIFCAGNHDIWLGPWDDRARITSWTKLRETLPRVARWAGFECVEEGPVRVDGVTFVGTIGWYDYSFRDRALAHALEAYRSKEVNGYVWQDRRFAFWDAPDEEVAEGLAEGLARAVDRAAADEGVERIVAVTHHVPFGRVVERSGHPVRDFFGAYMGSAALGRALKTSPKVTAALFGHTHRVIDTDVDGLRAVASPLGYLRRWRGDLAERVADRVAVLEI